MRSGCLVALVKGCICSYFRCLPAHDVCRTLASTSESRANPDSRVGRTFTEPDGNLRQKWQE